MWPRSRRIPHLVTRRSHPLHQSKTPTQEPGLGRHHRRFVFALSLADPPLISTLFHRSPLHHTFIFLFDFPQRTPSLKTIVQQAPEAVHLHQTHQTLKDPSIAKPEGLASLHIALATSCQRYQIHVATPTCSTPLFRYRPNPPPPPLSPPAITSSPLALAHLIISLDRLDLGRHTPRRTRCWRRKKPRKVIKQPRTWPAQSTFTIHPPSTLFA